MDENERKNINFQNSFNNLYNIMGTESAENVSLNQDDKINDIINKDYKNNSNMSKEERKFPNQNNVEFTRIISHDSLEFPDLDLIFPNYYIDNLPFYNIENETESINYLFNPNNITELTDDKKDSENKKRLGRKKKDSNDTGKHNKLSDDNLIRKIKSNILKIIRKYIDKIICKIYNKAKRYGEPEKKLLPLCKNIVNNSTVDCNKELLNKKLKDIFSEDISRRFLKYDKKHNKILIERLLNEKDETKVKQFKSIFDLTFLDCLRHFRGEIVIKELNRMENLDGFLEKLNADYEYKIKFKDYVKRFEKILFNKKRRNRLKNKIIK